MTIQTIMAAYTFLAMNGLQLVAREEEAVLQTLGLAAGEMDAEAYAAWLRRSCSLLQSSPSFNVLPLVKSKG
jgi:prophage maintenance system killer protein